MSADRRARLLLVGIIALGAALGAGAAWHWSFTFDESNHLEMGRRIVEDGDWGRFDNSKMPVSVLNALPWVLLQEADPRLRLWAARLPQLLWLAGTAAVAFAWAAGGRRSQQDGADTTDRRPALAAGLGAAAMVAWDPNLAAHGSLVTTDLPATFFTLLCCYTLLRLLEAPGPGGSRRAAAAGLAFGLAQAAKFTCAFLLPIELLIAAGWCLTLRTLRPLKWIPLFALAAWVGLNGAYAFQGTFTAGRDIPWQSQTFEPLRESAVPLPFPRPWLEGLDWVKADDDRGHGNIYADGRLTVNGQRDYYLRALGWKFPLPLLVLGLAGLVRRRPEAADLATLAPVGFLLLYFSLAFNFQLGLRYVLPVVPFFALWAARLSPRLLAAGVAWTLVSHLSWWPWTLSYFNERLTDRAQAWRHLADSNLDWGQTGRLTEAWRARHPSGLADPQVPAPGPALVSANALTGVLGDPARLACLREHHPPSEHLGYALYPYALTPDDLADCFPRAAVAGRRGGAITPGSAGSRVVVLWFRGEASLTVGQHTWSGSGKGETLLGAVIDAERSFDLSVSHEGPEARLFVDGVEVSLAGTPLTP